MTGGTNLVVVTVIAMVAVICMINILLGSSGDPEYTFVTEVPASGFQPQSPLCSFKSKDHISSFIWSHRASVQSESNGSIDGSKEALQTLLDSGITNFDIDISVHDNEFYVAHPTLLDSLKAKVKKREGEEQEPSRSSSSLAGIQTLTEFLEQIQSHSNVQRILERDAREQYEDNSYIINPLGGSEGTSTSEHHVEFLPSLVSHVQVFITLEPKFNDPQELKDMVTLLYVSDGTGNHHTKQGGSSLAEFAKDHVAIISNTPAQLTLLEGFLPGAGIDTELGASSVTSRSGSGSGSDYAGRTPLQVLFKSMGIHENNINLSDMYIAASMRSNGGVKETALDEAHSGFAWNGSPNWHLNPHASSTNTNIKIQDDISHIGRGHHVLSDISGIEYGGIQTRQPQSEYDTPKGYLQG